MVKSDGRKSHTQQIEEKLLLKNWRDIDEYVYGVL